jgi:hypothetical protein
LNTAFSRLDVTTLNFMRDIGGKPTERIPFFTLNFQSRDFQSKLVGISPTGEADP